MDLSVKWWIYGFLTSHVIHSILAINIFNVVIHETCLFSYERPASSSFLTFCFKKRSCWCKVQSSEWVFFKLFYTAFYFLSICGSLNTQCDEQKVVYRWALVRMWPQLIQCVPSCLVSFLLRSSALPADTALINKSFSCGRHSEAENLFFGSRKFS